MYQGGWGAGRVKEYFPQKSKSAIIPGRHEGGVEFVVTRTGEPSTRLRSKSCKEFLVRIMFDNYLIFVDSDQISILRIKN